MFLTLAIVLILSVLLTKIGTRLGIPGLILFLALGMIFGSDGLGVIYFDDPEAAQLIAIGALVIILFEGGFNTHQKMLEMAWRPSFSLATIGVVITAVTLGVLAYFILNLSLEIALLIGAIISSTDAAAIFFLFRNKSLEPRTAATIEIESAANDPMAIILTVSIISFILGDLSRPYLFIVNLVWQIGAGVAIGYLIGKVGPVLFNRMKFETGSFYSLLLLGLLFAGYGIADLINANGFIAVFLAGLLIGNKDFVFRQGIVYFLEGLSTFAHVLLFVMLGLLVFPSQVMAFWKDGLIIAVMLIFIARPIAVYLSTIFWSYSNRERLFISWAGLKGAVPIVLATYPLVAGIQGAGYIFNTVFFVVIISALVQGSTIDFVASKLHLLSGFKKRISHSMELVSFEKSNYELIEYTVCDDDTLIIGKSLNEIPFPKHCLVTAIVRDNDVVTPKGSTTLKTGDDLFILTRYTDKDGLLNVLSCAD